MNNFYIQNFSLKKKKYDKIGTFLPFYEHGLREKCRRQWTKDSCKRKLNYHKVFARGTSKFVFGLHIYKYMILYLSFARLTIVTLSCLFVPKNNPFFKKLFLRNVILKLTLFQPKTIIFTCLYAFYPSPVLYISVYCYFGRWIIRAHPLLWYGFTNPGGSFVGVILKQNPSHSRLCDTYCGALATEFLFWGLCIIVKMMSSDPWNDIDP